MLCLVAASHHLIKHHSPHAVMLNSPSRLQYVIYSDKDKRTIFMSHRYVHSEKFRSDVGGLEDIIVRQIMKHCG